MDKLRQQLKIIDNVMTRLALQKMEPTKYFFTSMFSRRSDLNYYNIHEIGRWWKKYVEAKKKGRIKDKLNLYVHIPFCETRCTFCRFPMTTTFDENTKKSYLERISKEMSFFKGILSSQCFDNIYIGGGSPNVLSLRETEFLSKSIFGNFKFSPYGERTFECSPVNNSRDKLKLLRKLGFNRISVGVETLDRRALQYANRSLQTADAVKKMVADAHKCGFIVNIDLMVGLYGETPSGIKKTFSKIIEFHPQRISIYALSPSENYLNAFFGGKESAFFSFLKGSIDKSFKELKKIAVRNGYSHHETVGLNEGSCIGFNSPDNRKEKGGYFTKELNNSCLAFGSFAVSKIASLARYTNTARIKDSISFSSKCYKGALSSPKDDMRDYILEFFSKRLPVYRDEFRNIFGRDLLKTFDYTFSSLKKLEKIEIAKEYVRFLPSARKEMFKYGLLFWDTDELKKVYGYLLA